MKAVAWLMYAGGVFIAAFTDNYALAACDLAAGCFFLLVDIGDKLERLK